MRLGLVGDNDEGTDRLEIHGYRKFRCADYAGLGEIIEAYLAEHHGAPLLGVAVACAGYPLADGTLMGLNLPWPVSLPELRQRLGTTAVDLVNDFEAVAHAAVQVDPDQALHLTGPATPDEGPVLVVGPGTGLGAALWVPTQRDPVVLATEAGHASLAVATPLEMDILSHLMRTSAHVPVEHVLSGPGLARLHAALCELHGEANPYSSPAAISGAAIEGSDPRARQSLEVFCGLLGSIAGDMALLYGARGGIYLAGGILSQMRDFLSRSNFVERFLAKGAMRPALERIPVKLVEHGRLGVIGAAIWYLDRHEAHASRGSRFPHPSRVDAAPTTASDVAAVHSRGEQP